MKNSFSTLCLSIAVLSTCGVAMWMTACSTSSSGSRSARAAGDQPQGSLDVIAAVPNPGDEPEQPGAKSANGQQVIDLTEPGAVVRSTTEAVVMDTRTWPEQLQPIESESPRRVREVLPPHGPPPSMNIEVANTLPVGTTLDEYRTRIGPLWPGIGQTGWVPPDPALAVGPNHVVATVNQSIAWYNRSGTVQFTALLNVNGNPGFFEPVGAGGFTFDPKCFYDHFAQRFVVMAPEYYSASQETYICIAVSDDSDPNGVWYKYRTDAVITVGTSTYWWDYPGFGYDGQAYYVTGNLFGLNVSGFGGAGYRVFDKAPMLNGSPAVYSTLRDGSAASVQVAQHFGTPIAPYMVSTNGSSSIKIQTIRNPLTAPTISTTNVSVPTFAGPTTCPTPGGTLGLVDGRIMNVCWRNGVLHAAHTISASGRNFARWYQFNTNTWPTSGSVTLAQSGNVDAGPGIHSFFPAIYSASNGDVGMVVGVSSETMNVSVAVTGRRAADPAGRMGVPEIVKLGESAGAGRWGDYYDIAIDPANDTTFWVVGEYPRAAGGWANWITSFATGDDPLAHAVPDDAGLFVGAQSRTIDVLSNDWSSTGSVLTIDSFTPTSVRGGIVTRSVGTGPGGRDQLTYTSPAGVNNSDSFSYTVRDTSSNTNSGAVSAVVYDPSTFRDPENPDRTASGIEVDYFAVSDLTVLPDFSTLTPYLSGVVPSINFASSNGNFATSGVADNVAARFAGYVRVPTADLYTFSTESDDGSRLLIGTTQVVSNDGAHGMQERTGSIGLKAGVHRVTVEFFEGAGGAGLIVRRGIGSGTRSVIATTDWFHQLCNPDYNQDGGADTSDIIDLANDIASGQQSFPPSNPDFNGDGGADTTDIIQLADVVAGSPCP